MAAADEDGNVDRDGSGYHDDHRERKESGSRGEQEAEAKEQKREKATRGE